MNDRIAQGIKNVRFDESGLIPVIAQDHQSLKVLMFAWMDQHALVQTIETGHAVYFSRSRQKLWYKGEESGHLQIVKSIRYDCDEDVILLLIEQVGGIACHTGRNSCFYREWDNDKFTWNTIESVLKAPEDIYAKPTQTHGPL